jgi:hypothetical protein
MTSIQKHVALNARIAQSIWGPLTKPEAAGLKELLRRFRFSIAQGDLQYLDKGWYVTHAGLLRLAQRRRCAGIRVQSVHEFCKPESCTWVFKATVYKSARSNAYMGYGDADPSNVSPLVRGAEMRVAETRAVNRALRKAYGIGLCSVEELGSTPKVSPSQSSRDGSSAAGASGNGRSAARRLRDRLCLLIRQHQLDATLVKAYAADFCGTPNLRDASREQIEGFIANLADWATKDRPALLCKLNSYAAPDEVRS